MDLRCNVQTCRKILTGIVWVTSCSHSFCEEHASTISHKNNQCPACQTSLGKRFDVIRQNSEPSEEYKSMLLVGLRPEIVLDIAMSAVSFWNYQAEQEHKFQSTSGKHLREIVEKMKTNNAVLMKQLSTVKKTSERHERQIGDLKHVISQLKEQIASKDLQLIKVQHLFDSFKSKTNFVPLEIENTPDNDQDLKKNSSRKPDFVFEPRFPK